MDLKPQILVVDDEPLNIEIIVDILSERDYQITTANNGASAWEMLISSPDKFDVILLDKMMPEMNGLELMDKLAQHPVLQHCAIILQTASSGGAEIAEGLEAGAQYYLTKPFEQSILLSVVKTAVRDRLNYRKVQQNLNKNHSIMGLLQEASFEFKTIDEAHTLASLLSHAYPEPTSIIMGLSELMVNAVEHGNLAITYAEKSELNRLGSLGKEIERRLDLPEYKDKVASVHFLLLDDGIDITIKDQGAGFDCKKYMDFDPGRLMDTHGRGIAVANKLSFSEVLYKGIGNEVVARLRL